jgi:hypothetical protein
MVLALQHMAYRIQNHAVDRSPGTSSRQSTITGHSNHVARAQDNQVPGMITAIRHHDVRAEENQVLGTSSAIRDNVARARDNQDMGTSSDVRVARAEDNHDVRACDRRYVGVMNG